MFLLVPSIFLAHHTSKKEPITIAQLEQLVNSKALSIAPLYDIHSVLICLLAFAAFLRYDELAKLVRSDVEIDSEKLQLFIITVCCVLHNICILMNHDFERHVVNEHLVH